MDLILTILFLCVLIFGFERTFRGIKQTTKATLKTFTEGGDIVSNIKEEFRDIGLFEVQTNNIKVKIGDRNVDAIEVQIRGLINATRTTEMTFVTSLFDYSEEKYEAVLSSIEVFRESATDGYQNVVNVPSISPNMGYKNWITVATIYPEILVGTKKGKRKIRIFVRAIPSKELTKINYGLHDEGTEIFVSVLKDIDLVLIEKGWRESELERDEARSIIVKLAVAIASEDGKMNPSEGKAIQAWIKQEISYVGEQKKEFLKNLLNTSLKESFKDAELKKLKKLPLISRLKEINIGYMNQSLLELLVKVIGADSEITKAEMKAINQVASELNINLNDLKAMTDKAFLEMSDMSMPDETMESLLGINASWTKEQIKTHLNKEFAKWNGRIQALENEEEKNKAQKMLDAIASARKKYGN
jgi:uncharacterized tellurite resistance protein B-like protein